MIMYMVHLTQILKPIPITITNLWEWRNSGIQQAGKCLQQQSEGQNSNPFMGAGL